MKTKYTIIFQLLLSAITYGQSSANTSKIEREAASKKAPISEYQAILRKEGGKEAVKTFEYDLSKGLHLRGEIKTRARIRKARIEKFTLKLKNTAGINGKIVIHGFQKLEFNWKLNDEQEFYDLNYQMNDGQKNPIRISRNDGLPRFKMKHRLH